MAQEQLRDVWLQAQLGHLCAWAQAKALALREASRELGAIESRGRNTMSGLIGADKLEEKRTEPSWSHPGAIGTCGRTR